VKHRKHTPKFIDRNLKTDDQILIIFGTNILDTTRHQMTIYVPASPNLCFCTTCGNKTSKKCIFIERNIIIWFK